MLYKTKKKFVVITSLVMLFLFTLMMIPRIYLQNVYTNHTFGFQIKYPNKHKVRELQLKDEGYMVIFQYISSRNPTYQVPLPSITIYINKSLESKVNKARAKSSTLKEEDVTVDGYNGIKLTNKDPTLRLPSTHIFIERDELLYVFSEMPTLMFKSFQFLN